MNCLSLPVTVRRFICLILILYFLALWTDFLKDQMSQANELEKLYELLFPLAYHSLISSWNVKRREWLTYFYTKKYLIVLLISLSLSYATDEVDNLQNSSWHSPYFYPSLHSKVNSNPLFPKDLIQVFSNPSSTSYGQPNQMLFIYSIFLSQQLAPHSCTDLFWYPGLLTTLPNFQLWIYSSLL